MKLIPLLNKQTRRSNLHDAYCFMAFMLDEWGECSYSVTFLSTCTQEIRLQSVVGTSPMCQIVFLTGNVKSIQFLAQSKILESTKLNGLMKLSITQLLSHINLWVKLSGVVSWSLLHFIKVSILHSDLGHIWDLSKSFHANVHFSLPWKIWTSS